MHVHIQDVGEHITLLCKHFGWSRSDRKPTLLHHILVYTHAVLRDRLLAVAHAALRLRTL